MADQQPPFPKGATSLDNREVKKWLELLRRQQNSIQTQLDINSNLISALQASGGVVVGDVDGNFITREIVSGSDSIVITNGDGINGNPTISFDDSQVRESRTLHINTDANSGDGDLFTYTIPTDILTVDDDTVEVNLIWTTGNLGVSQSRTFTFTLAGTTIDSHSYTDQTNDALGFSCHAQFWIMRKSASSVKVAFVINCFEEAGTLNYSDQFAGVTEVTGIDPAGNLTFVFNDTGTSTGTFQSAIIRFVKAPE